MLGTHETGLSHSSAPAGPAPEPSGELKQPVKSVPLEVAPGSGTNPLATMRLVLKNSDVGKIIGPKGKTVEGYKKQSSANIRVSTYTPSMPRIATVTGSVDSVVKATMLICRAVAAPEADGKQQAAGDAASEDAPRVALATGPSGRNGEMSVVMVVPFPHIGRVIGKKGQRINQLREDTKTSVRVVQNNVSVTGQVESVERAVRSLTVLLHDVSKRNPVSGPFMFPFDRQPPRAAGARRGGSTTAPPALILSGQGPAALQFRVNNTPNSMQIVVPSASAGVVIGRGGATIQRLKTESGASISISAYIKGAKNRIATLSGSTEAMAKAIMLIAECMASEAAPDAAVDPATGQATAKLSADDQALSIVLLVPPNELGAIIGKRGVRVSELRRETGARINIADEGCVTVSGSSASVAAATTRITTLINDARSTGSAAASNNAGAPKSDPSEPAAKRSASGAGSRERAEASRKRDASAGRASRKPSALGAAASSSKAPGKAKGGKGGDTQKSRFPVSVSADPAFAGGRLMFESMIGRPALSASPPRRHFPGVLMPGGKHPKSMPADGTAGNPHAAMFGLGAAAVFPPSPGYGPSGGAPMFTHPTHAMENHLVHPSLAGQPAQQGRQAHMLMLGNQWAPQMPPLSQTQARGPHRNGMPAPPDGREVAAGRKGQQVPTFNSPFPPVQGTIAQPGLGQPPFYAGTQPSIQWYPAQQQPPPGRFPYPAPEQWQGVSATAAQPATAAAAATVSTGGAAKPRQSQQSRTAASASGKPQQPRAAAGAAGAATTSATTNSGGGEPLRGKYLWPS